MKKISVFATVMFCVISLSAQPPKGPADKGMHFGVKTTESGAIGIDSLSSALAGKTTADIKVKGKVAEVCKAEGCWLKMETPNGLMMIRMKDHSFMVPLSLNGKTIIATGTVNYKETSVERLKHYAEDAGKTQEEIAKIVAPKKEMTMDAAGILVL